MITRTTWALIGVLGLLLAVFYFSQRAPDESEVEATPTTALSFLLEIGEDQVTGLEITGPESQFISIERETDGSWLVPGAAFDQVDQAAIAGAVRQLGSLRLLSELGEVPDLEIYGLTLPRYTLKVQLAGGDSVEIAVGDSTPTGGGYYVQVDGQAPRVVNLVNLEPILNLASTPPLLPTPEITATIEPVPTTE